jgi:hypothetical protein
MEQNYQHPNGVYWLWNECEDKNLPEFYHDPETGEHFPDRLPLSNKYYPMIAQRNYPGILKTGTILVTNLATGETFTIFHNCRVGVLSYKCWLCFDNEGCPLIFFDKTKPLDPIPDARTPEQLANPLLEFAG